ncbi:MAG: hypothetical protein E7510_04130 [Ruminococcus sp.]|jgi:hypothetical protein|nr:hypothetical protein [Ruminococcus sp.]
MKKYRFLTILTSVCTACLLMGSSANNAMTCDGVEDIPDPNGDGVVNVADLAYMMQCLNGIIAPTYLYSLDINNNNIVSQVDLELLKQHLLNG